MNEIKLKSREIAEISVCALQMEEISDYILSSEKQIVISTLSMPMLGEVKKNIDYKKALKNSEIVLPDGIGIVFLSKIIGGKYSIKKRITGPDFFLFFNRVANKENLSYFFLGSTEKTLSKIKERIGQEWPNIKVSGVLSPPFGQWTDEINNKIIENINRVNPDVLWVGMTAPKQEIWVFKNRGRLTSKIIASIGAAFDFYAGTKKRAPKIFQNLGLEWLYRTAQEPVRMGKRYLKGLPAFIYFSFEGFCKRFKK